MNGIRRLRALGRMHFKALSALLALILISITGWVYIEAQRSSLFLLRMIEVIPVEGLDSIPLRTDEIAILTGIKLNKVSLFTVDLEQVRKELLQNEWIEDVRLFKRFPQTLEIQVEPRFPMAILIDTEKGSMRYVSRSGRVFFRFDSRYFSNLPTITGVSKDDSMQLQFAIQLLDSFSNPVSLPQRHVEDAAKAQVDTPNLMDSTLLGVEWTSQRGWTVQLKAQKRTFILEAGKDVKMLNKGRVDAFFAFLKEPGSWPANILASSHVRILWITDKKIIVKSASNS